MESRFLVHLLDVSLRSLPLAMAGFALVRFARLRSSAQVHAVWTTVMLGMLGLFFAGPSLKPLPLRVLPAPQIAIGRARCALNAPNAGGSASGKPVRAD